MKGLFDRVSTCSMKYQMSIYEMLTVDKLSHPYDIESAGKSAMCRMNLSSLKQWLTEHGTLCTDDALAKLLLNMQRYIATSTHVLLDPGLKDCYNAWLDSKHQDLHHQTLTKARILYINSLNGFSFGEGCFEHLPHAAKSLTVEYGSTPRVPENLKCRWCKKTFDLKSFTIYQCQCAARVGHSACGKQFVDEYKNRCPVCRSTMLNRKEISKYMFWSIAKKYKI